MDLFTIWKFLHIATLFFAVALAISGELVMRRVAASRDVRAIRTVVTRVRPLSGPLAGGLMIAGIVFGFLAALTGQMDLLRPWLVLSYVAVAAAFVLGATITDPWVDRLAESAANSPDDASSDELIRVIEDPRARFATGGLLVLIAVLVFLMVVKPLG